MAAESLKLSGVVKGLALKPPRVDPATGALGRSAVALTLVCELSPEEHADVVRLVVGANHEVQVTLQAVQGSLGLRVAQ